MDYEPQRRVHKAQNDKEQLLQQCLMGSLLMNALWYNT